jgi:DNA polymerase III epsilon subunit-like protein
MKRALKTKAAAGPVVLFGDTFAPAVDSWRVTYRRMTGAVAHKAFHPEAPLSEARLEEHLEGMRARGVCLLYDGAAFELRWPSREARDFRDVERVEVNFARLLRRFALHWQEGEAVGHLPVDAPVHTLPLAFVDLETTGGSTEQDRITEVYVYLQVPGEEPQEFHSLVNPGRPIPWRIVQLTGITDEMVRGAPLFGEIARDVERLLRDAVVVQHSSSWFDVRFLEAELQRAEIEWAPAARLDTQRIAKATWPKLGKYSLEHLGPALKLPRSQAHRARSDVEDMRGLFGLVLKERPGVTLRELVRL